MTHLVVHRLSLGGQLIVADFVAPDEIPTLMAALVAEVDLDRYSIQLFGKKVLQPRLVGWQGERPYRYSGLTLAPRPWSETTQLCLQKVHSFLREVAPDPPPFNHVLFNYYRDGSDSMGLHADDEPELGPDPWIASLSLGAPRTFLVCPKKKFRKEAPSERLRIQLESGSLLVMQPPTQRYYLHGIPKQPGGAAPRLNLTFRHVQPEETP